MKRLICILLSSILLFSSVITVKAEEKEENIYYNIQVEFSDKEGVTENLQVMVKDNNVYANAQQLGERLGYQVGISDKYVAVYNKEENANVPYGMTLFYFDSTKIQHMLFNKLTDYEAVFASIKNSDGAWIPLEQALLLLNSSMLIVDSTVLIDMPTKNIVDIYMDIMKKNQKYEFDWTSDIGISEDNLLLMKDSAEVITVLNGMLKMDGESWAQMIHWFALDSSPYDEKYGEKLAMLFCTYSDSEFKAEIKNIKEVLSHINGKGALGKTVTALNKQQTQTITNLQNKLKESIDYSNSESIAKYNRTYQALEKANAQDDVLSGLTGLYTSVQKEVAGVTSMFDKLCTIAEVVGYVEEFTNQDKFAVQALTDFSVNTASESNMSQAMKESISVYTEMLKSNVAEYSALRYLQENYEDIILKAADLSSALLTEAKLMLIVWDLLSEKVLFYSDGISEADSALLSLYADVFEADALINYQSSRNEVFQDSSNITATNLCMVTEYCYVYLKACYINRQASLGALSSDTKEKIPYTINAQQTINEEIAEYLVELKNADTTNEDLKYGFLLDNNKEYLEKYDSSKLISCVKGEHSNENIIFNSIPQNFVFSSGVGGWSTEIEIKNDGTFTGLYHDTNMEETYICNFSGKFCDVKQIDDYTYSMSLEYLKIEGTPGEVYYKDNIKYIYSEPYGFDNANEFIIYLPGVAVSKLPEEFLMWAKSIVYKKIKDILPDGYYWLYNVGGKEGFIGSFDW